MVKAQNRNCHPIMYPEMVGKSKLLFGLLLVLIGQCNSSQSNCYPVEDPTSVPNTTITQVTLEGQCFTACIAKYQDIIRPEKFYHLSGEWYSVSYASFSQNCSYLQKVLECKSGCLLRPHTNTRTECRDSCHDMCSLECNDSCQYSVDTVCTRQCKRPPCNRGCIEYTDTIINGVGVVPSPPASNHLQLINNMNKPGFVMLDISNTNATSNDVTSFVIKLEQNQDVRYLWMPTLTYSHLDLTQYSCQYINISYAPVNKYGRSSFSPIISHYVSGEQRFPQQVNATTIQFAYIEDTRPMYVGNVFVNVSWSQPTGLNYATHFELRLQQIPNPISYSFMINKTLQYYILQATSPGAAPAFGKTYAVTFIVHPSAPSDSHTHRIMTPRTGGLTPNMTLACSSLKSDMLNISLSWEIDNNTNVIDTIEEYRIEVSGSNGEIMEQIVIQNQDYNFVFSEMIGPYYLHNRGSQYQYTIELIPIKSSDYFWRNVPLPVSCIINGTLPDLPPLPIPISCINVNHSNNEDNIVIRWCQPSMTYGPIISYQLLIGDTILNVSGNITRQQTISVEQYGDCSLLQIRSNNGFDWSKWSLPLLAIPCIPSSTTRSSWSSSISSSISSSGSLSTDISSDSIMSLITTSIVTTPVPSSLSTTTTTVPSTFSSSKSSVGILFPSSTVILSVQPTSSITQITSTIYFLSAIIVLLLILIPLTIIGLIFVCFRYRQTKMMSSVHNFTTSLEEKQDRKFVPSAENKLAVENIYATISTPV